MENPLSQAELDAVMEEFYESGDSIRPYDFKRPSKFGKDRIQALLMIHENFARLLTGFFAAQLRTRVQVTLRNVNQYSFGEFTQIIVNPTVLCAFRLDPLPGVALLEISQNIAFAIVERIFGGTGGDDQPQRALSEIELSVLQRQVTDMFTPLQEAWRNVADIKPTVEAIETNPLFMQVMAPGEVLAALTMGVQMGEHYGHLTLALPFTTVEPVLTKLSPYNWFSQAEHDDETKHETMTASVEQASVQLTVVLGTVKLTMGDLMNLKAGDLITLTRHPSDELEVFVGGRHTFLARPGVSRGRAAVQVTRYAPTVKFPGVSRPSSTVAGIEV